jgi:hypothetical protein
MVKTPFYKFFCRRNNATLFIPGIIAFRASGKNGNIPGSKTKRLHIYIAASFL